MEVSNPTRARWTDLAFCLALLVLGLPPTLSSDPDIGAGTWLDTLLLPTVLIAVPLRRRSPLLAAGVFMAACGVSAIPTFDQLRIPVVVGVAMAVGLALGRESDRAAAAAGLALILAGLAIDGATEQVVDTPLDVLAFGAPLTAVSFGAGRLIRSRNRLAAELEATTLALEHRREATAELAVEVERARLASELDAAARRRVRKIVEIAAGGERDGPPDPGPARYTFADIERMGRASLNDMRQLLGVLRSDEPATRAPGPTLGELEALLADMRRGGRPVELAVEGHRCPLPSGIELAAYRTLQHALVAVRGTDQEPVTIVMRYTPDTLEVEVRGAPLQSTGANAALAAAQERVRAQGGSFESSVASPTHRVLNAKLPLVASRA